MKSLRWLLIGLLIVTAPLSLWAGGQDETEADEVTLLYWTHNHAPSIPVNEAIIDEFVAENPGVEIIFDNAPHENYEQRLMTAFAGGQGPDVFWAGDWMVPQFLRNNMIAPVDPTAFGAETHGQFEELFAPGSLEAFKRDGLIYTGGVSEYNSFSLIYNVAHFEEAGLDRLSETDPITWDELIEIGRTLSQEENGATTRVGLTWPFAVPIWTVLIVEPMVRQLGGELIDPATGEPQFDSPEVVRTMEVLQRMHEERVIDTAFFIDLLQDFAGGRASSIIAGPWAAQPLREINPDLEWAVAPLPQFDSTGERVTTLYAWAWYVNANIPPERQALAWRFVETLTSAQTQWWDSVGYVQARLGETVDGVSFDDYRAQSDERLQVIFNDYPFGRYQFRSTSYFELSDLLTRATTVILAGGDIAAVLDETQGAALEAVGF